LDLKDDKGETTAGEEYNTSSVVQDKTSVCRKSFNISLSNIGSVIDIA
jgi:hypothetical protein